MSDRVEEEKKGGGRIACGRKQTVRSAEEVDYKRKGC